MSTQSHKEDGKPAQQWYWDDWFSSHDVQSCSLDSQGLWINLLGIMFTSEIRGTLTINGIAMDNKSIAKRFRRDIKTINKLMTELEGERVFSRLDDGTIYSRRMYRESRRKEEISRIRSQAGTKGMKKRWKQTDNKPITEADNKTITNITASSPTSSSSPTSTPKKEEKNKTARNDKNHSKPPSIFFDFDSQSWEGITDKDKAFWEKAYPACDIEHELLMAGDWLISNPQKRKKNYRAFISRWLVKQQDRGGSKGIAGKDPMKEWAEKRANK